MLKFPMSWQKRLKNKIKNKEPLKKHTTFKIGGAAEYFYQPENYKDLSLALRLAKKQRIKVLILGLGSNILVSDKGVKALVLKLNSPYFKEMQFKGLRINAGAGCMLGRAIKECAIRGLSGVEFLTGIPGTIGGALIMNAGIPKNNIGDLVENVLLMDYNGKIKTLAKAKIRFTYRNSNLSKYIILRASLRLIKKNKNKIREALNQYIQRRKLGQDLTYPSAGCVFKNPDNESAGKLIDLCGLKGKKIGGALVSNIHANFIINKRNAKAADVLKLAFLIKKQVKSKFGIELKPEIKIWK